MQGEIGTAWEGHRRAFGYCTIVPPCCLLSLSSPSLNNSLASRFNFATLSQVISLCCNLGSRAGTANTQNLRSTSDPLGSSVAARSYFADAFGIDTRACPRGSHRGWTEEWTLSPRLRTTLPETTPWRRCPPPCLSKRRPHYPMGLRSKSSRKTWRVLHRAEGLRSFAIILLNTTVMSMCDFWVLFSKCRN